MINNYRVVLGYLKKVAIDSVIGKTEKSDLWSEFKYYNDRGIFSRKLSKKEFIRLLDRAPIIHLTPKDMRSLGNSYIPDFQNVDTMAGRLKSLEEIYRHDIRSTDKSGNPIYGDVDYLKSLIDKVSSGQYSYPLILNINGTRFICGGRTRIAIAYTLGQDLEAKEIKFDNVKKDSLKDLKKELMSQNVEIGF